MAKNNSHVQGIAVQIFGEEYLIAESDAVKVQKIASYVDEKMREIDGQHPGRIPTSKLAVLAAMTIADELMQTLSEQNRLAETAQENLQRLTELVDARASMVTERVDELSQPRRRWREEGEPQLDHAAAK
jgi:cell division protein ZapA (FtsZ GTPase activity inhibitor)